MGLPAQESWAQTVPPSPQKKPTGLHLDLGLPASRALRPRGSVVYTPGVGRFVRAALASDSRRLVSGKTETLRVVSYVNNSKLHKGQAVSNQQTRPWKRNMRRTVDPCDPPHTHTHSDFVSRDGPLRLRAGSAM